MAGFDKKPCPHCGEMVSQHPRWWKKHMATHETEEQPKTQEQKVEAVVEEKEVKESGKLDKDVLSKMSDEERDLVEKALKRQEENRKAPDAFVSLVSEDENMELRRLYAPETIPKTDKLGNILKPAERHAYIADGTKLRLAVDRGYVPVVKDNGELARTAHGDVLCTLDMGTHEAINAAIEKENLRRKGQSRKGKVSRSTTTVRGSDGKQTETVGEFDASSVEMDVSEQEISWRKE